MPYKRTERSKPEAHSKTAKRLLFPSETLRNAKPSPGADPLMPTAPCGQVSGKETLPILGPVFLAHAVRLVEMKRNPGRDNQAGKPLATTPLLFPVPCPSRLEPKVSHPSESFMQPPLVLSAVLLIPLVLPGILRAQGATPRDDRSQAAAQQSVGGTADPYQTGWYYPSSWPMNPPSFAGSHLYSDGGPLAFEWFYRPSPSFWFNQPSASFWYYQPSASFRYYQPSPSFWFYRTSPSFWFYRPPIRHPHH